jgi:hypothetical protein
MQDVAALTSLSPATLERALRAGLLKCSKVGRVRRFEPEEVRRFADKVAAEGVPVLALDRRPHGPAPEEPPAA